MIKQNIYLASKANHGNSHIQGCHWEVPVIRSATNLPEQWLEHHKHQSEGPHVQIFPDSWHNDNPAYLACKLWYCPLHLACCYIDITCTYFIMQNINVRHLHVQPCLLHVFIGNVCLKSMIWDYLCMPKKERITVLLTWPIFYVSHSSSVSGELEMVCSQT